MKRSLVLSYAILLATAASASCQLAESGWADYGGGYANQHRSPFVGISTSPQIAWAFDLKTIPTGYFGNFGFHQPILLPDATIVLDTVGSSGDSAMVALRPNGSLRWFSQASTFGPWLAADQNDQIYAITSINYISESTRLRAVSFSGSWLWTAGLSGSNPAQNGPAIGRDGVVYGANDFSPLTGITPEGTVAWTSINSGYYVNPAIDDRGTIYVGGNSLSALNPNGSVRWTYHNEGQSGYYLSPAIADDGTIYAGQIYPNSLVALSTDGQMIWSRSDLGGAPAVGINGDIYAVSESGVLYSINPTDGSTQWTYATGKTDELTCEGVTVDRLGNLYLANEDGVVMSLTPNGQLRWSLDIAPDQSGYIGPSAPVIGNDGTLYVVGGYTGKVFAIVPEPSTLALLLAAALGGLLWWRRNR